MGPASKITDQLTQALIAAQEEIDSQTQEAFSRIERLENTVLIQSSQLKEALERIAALERKLSILDLGGLEP